jgi:hypothetical protein
MRPLPVVIPIRDWDDRLPFERPIGIVDRQTKLATSTLDGAKRAVAARKTRPCMYRNLQLSDRECSLTPSPLVEDEFASSREDGDRGIDAFRLSTPIPGRDRSESDRRRQP